MYSNSATSAFFSASPYVITHPIRPNHRRLVDRAPDEFFRYSGRTVGKLNITYFPGFGLLFFVAGKIEWIFCPSTSLANSPGRAIGGGGGEWVNVT